MENDLVYYRIVLYLCRLCNFTVRRSRKMNKYINDPVFENIMRSVRVVTTALIGWKVNYSYIRVLPYKGTYFLVLVRGDAGLANAIITSVSVQLYTTVILVYRNELSSRKVVTIP